MVRAIDFKYDGFENGYDAILLTDTEPATDADFPATADDVYNLKDAARAGRALLPGCLLMTAGMSKVWQLGTDGNWVLVGEED